MIYKKRSLGFWICLALVMGNVVGSGAYILPGLSAKYGSINILGWILATVAAMSVAYMLSRLSLLFPNVGGPYAYVHKAFPDAVASLVAWSYWIAAWSGNAAVVMIFIDYLADVSSFIHSYKILTAVAILWFFTFFNSFTVYFSGLLQLWLMILKIVSLALLLFFAAFYVDWHNFNDLYNPDYSLYTSISQTYVLVWWSFIGLESATVPAEYIQKPKINIPRATIFGTGIVGILYIILNIISIGVLSIDKLMVDVIPLASIAQIIWGEAGRYFALFGVSMACLGVINGFTILQGQIPHGAAKDNLFPPYLSKVNAYNVPIVPMYIGTILSSALLLISQIINTQIGIFEFVASISIFTTMLTYIFCSFVEYLYRKKQNPHNQHGRLLLLAIVVSVVSGMVIALMDWQVIIASSAVLLLLFGLSVALLHKKM